MSITGEARAQLLKFLKNGHDLLAACDKAGVELDLVKSDPDLLRECEAAFTTATSRLRSRLTEKCLAGGAGDITTLQRTIEGRGDLQKTQFAPTPGSGPNPWVGIWEALVEELGDDALAILTAMVECRPEEVNRIVDRMAQDRARRLVAEEAEQIIARRIERGELIRPKGFKDLDTLDATAPLARDRSMVPIQAKPSLSSPLVRGYR